MHIAQIFNQCSLLADQISFTREFKVRRKWPVESKGRIDTTFFTEAVLVRFDAVRQKFQYCITRNGLEEKLFTDIQEKYLQDNAWKYSTSEDVKPKAELGAKALEKAKQGKQKFADYQLQIKYEDNQNMRSCLLRCVRKPDSIKISFKAHLLRV